MRVFLFVDRLNNNEYYIIANNFELAYDVFRNKLGRSSFSMVKDLGVANT